MSGNAVFKYLQAKFLYPFKEQLPFFLLIWLMLAFPDFAVEIAKKDVLTAIGFSVFYYFVAYLIVFVTGLSRRLSPLLRVVFFATLIIYTIINLYCIITYHTRVTHNIIEIFANTNAEEVGEYLRMYTGLREALLIAGVVVAGIILYILSVKMGRRMRGRSAILWGVLLGVSVVSAFLFPSIRPDVYAWNFNLDDVADPSRYHTAQQVVAANDSVGKPQIVIIIGESFSPGHSSLYGYGRDTNPRLARRLADGSLVVFDSVHAPATSTAEAFKYILNTNRADGDSEEKWYKATNLIEVLKNQGYHTRWLSNQSQKGLYNNIGSAYSNVCDESFFIRSYANKKTYDGDLIEHDTSMPGDTIATIYHLLGQHVLFNERYPEGFGKFSSEMYADYRPAQRQTVAEYDNATLYNDSIVNDIIAKYSDRNSIVFYFSDHGLDIYDTDPNYVGHATQNPVSQEFGKRIPFMIYMSPEFKQANPSLATRVELAARNAFSTDSFTFLVMDILGLRFAGNNDVATFSPLGK